MPSARTAILIAFILALAVAARGDWQLQPSNSKAGLRGVHAVDASVAWASGTGGTVLRTTDGGMHWQKCTTPPGADKLDFRAIRAWNADTAIIMSAGPGDQSRIYRTKDGCATWTEERRNTEPDGFWDALVFDTVGKSAVLIGDPVRGRFHTETFSGPQGWTPTDACASSPGEAAFAASNSSAFVFGPRQYILGTGGKGGPRALLSPRLAGNRENCLAVAVPISGGTESSGVFSISFRNARHGVAVGGDYKQPTAGSQTAAWTADGGRHWTAAVKPPQGYRSAVAWHETLQCWIAAGSNGSDLSCDDGKAWSPLDQRNWNALSLPYAVGPQGRIAKLRADTIKR